MTRADSASGREPTGHPTGPAILDVPYGANEIRLSPRQWLVVILIVVGCFLIVPRLWKRLEVFQPGNNYRIPYLLSEDYWHYQRWLDETIARDGTPVVGDSVIWGEYVSPDATLSRYLNQRLATEQFTNAGLNGTHPLSLEGLVKHHTQGLRGRRVILHCNLLWSSSPQHDLQSEKEVSFNHPRLVPQLARRIPSYKASADERIGNFVDHRLSLRGWVHHLRIAHFDSLDLPNWSFEHPYRNPISRITLRLPAPAREPRHEAMPWFERGIEEREFAWVDPSSSLQLDAFRRTVRELRGRGNSVFVLVGPFNEHLLAGAASGYKQLKESIARWLLDEQVPHLLPGVLPRDEYGDASHPLAAGYRRLAEEIAADAGFQDWWAGGR